MRAVVPLEVVSGHLVTQIGAVRALLDTGAPLSFGSGALTLLERPVPLLDTALGVTSDYITGKVGARVDALLGTDLVDGRKARIALPDWEMVLSESSG